MKSGPKPKPALDRFLARVVKKEDGCWIFGGNEADYGQIHIAKGKMVSAHRFSYEHYIGPLAPGMYVCHKCDVKGCVNPEHLYQGTHEDNIRDIVERKRGKGRKVLTKYAKPLGNRYKNGRILGPEGKARLKQEWESGRFTQMELAKRYRVSQSVVSKIARGCYDDPYKANPTGGKRRTGFFRRKMKPEAYREIEALYQTGDFTQVQLAEKFNCTQTYISRILHKLNKGR